MRGRVEGTYSPYLGRVRLIIHAPVEFMKSVEGTVTVYSLIPQQKRVVFPDLTTFTSLDSKVAFSTRTMDRKESVETIYVLATVYVFETERFALI